MTHVNKYILFPRHARHVRQCASYYRLGGGLSAYVVGHTGSESIVGSLRKKRIGVSTSSSGAVGFVAVEFLCHEFGESSRSKRWGWISAAYHLVV